MHQRRVRHTHRRLSECCSIVQDTLDSPRPLTSTRGRRCRSAGRSRRNPAWSTARAASRAVRPSTSTDGPAPLITAAKPCGAGLPAVRTTPAWPARGSPGAASPGSPSSSSSGSSRQRVRPAARPGRRSPRRRACGTVVGQQARGPSRSSTGVLAATNDRADTSGWTRPRPVELDRRPARAARYAITKPAVDRRRHVVGMPLDRGGVPQQPRPGPALTPASPRGGDQPGHDGRRRRAQPATVRDRVVAGQPQSRHADARVGQPDERAAG